MDAKVSLPTTNEPIPVVLLANKIDLLEEGRAREEWEERKEELDLFCKEHGFIAWFGISAKDSCNIDPAVTVLARETIRNYDRGIVNTVSRDMSIISPKPDSTVNLVDTTTGCTC